MITLTRIEDLSHLAQIAALLAAATYFGYRSLTGHFLNNLTVELKLNRIHRTNADDVLAVRVALQKHDVTAARLLSVRGRALEMTNSQPGKLLWQCDKFPGFVRVADTSWDSLDANPLSLAINERMASAVAIVVPRSADVFVEIVVLGARRFLGRTKSQWRTSGLSLAQSEAESASTANDETVRAAAE